MPNLVWQCATCHKLHPTCDAAARCERMHPAGTVFCDSCKGTGDDLYCLDKCGHCNGAGVRQPEKEEGTGT